MTCSKWHFGQIGNGGKRTIWGFFLPKFGQKGLDFLQWEFIDYNIASINGSKKCRQFLNTQKCRNFNPSFNFININSNSITQHFICKRFGDSCV
jgi:hypothetical protein